MVCEECCHWKCGKITYAELVERWDRSIGGIITPGHERRFLKESIAKKVPFEEAVLGYKYCSKGILTRFYVQKNEKDTKAMISRSKCSAFQSTEEGSVTIKIPSPLWTTCTVESHGPSKVKGIPFTTGLYERGIYFRVPMCGPVRPVVKNKKLTVTLSFDSNEEYLKWWGKLYPRSFEKLNR